MCCHSMKGLKDYLHEAMDHKILLEKNMEDGQSILMMPYPSVVLEKIVNDQLENEWIIT